MGTTQFRIESRQNPRFQSWLQMASDPQKGENPWIPLQGWKQIGERCEHDAPALLLYSDPNDRRLGPLMSRSRQAVQLAPGLLRLLSGVQTPQGVVAFFEKPQWTWDDMPPFLLYLEYMQDPGNLGTLMRTARAAGPCGIVCGPGSVSAFNPKVIRSSSTALFEVPCMRGIQPIQLARKEYRLWAATPAEGISLFEVEFDAKMAVMIGGEGAGLSDMALALADQRFRIPMHSGTESLNASVAGSLVIYEMYRRSLGGSELRA